MKGTVVITLWDPQLKKYGHARFTPIKNFKKFL